MNEDQFTGLMALLERIANALEGRPRPVDLHSGPRHLGQHGPDCLVCHPAEQDAIRKTAEREAGE
jgi:hypothetical protein